MRRTLAIAACTLAIACTTTAVGEGTSPPPASDDAGANECVEGSCYSGPPGTQGVGPCKVGVRSCGKTCVEEVVPVADVCETGEDEDCDGRAPPCPPAAATFQLGGSGDDHFGGLSTDAKGGIVVFGATETATNLGEAGPFVAKIDASGKLLWSKPMKRADTFVAAAAPDGTTVVAGNTLGPLDLGGGNTVNGFFAAALDAMGAPVWAKSFGDTLDAYMRVDSIAVGGDGSFAFGGRHGKPADFGGGTLDGPGAFFARLDVATGAHRTSHDMKCGMDVLFPRVAGIAVSKTGEVAATGIVNRDTDFGGGVEKAIGSDDAFVARYDATGAFVHGAIYGDAGEGQGGTAIAFVGSDLLVVGDLQGTLPIGGETLGTGDGFGKPFAVAFDSKGNVKSSRAFAGNFASYVAALTPDGTRAVGGFDSTLDLDKTYTARDTDAWVAQIAPDGTTSKAMRIGPQTRGTVNATAIATLPDGRVVVGGDFDQTVDTGERVLTTIGKRDIYVAVFP